MSKAFTREETDGPNIPELPPLAPTLPLGAKNYMTPDGAARLREELVRLVEVSRPRLAASRDDPIRNVNWLESISGSSTLS